MLLYMLTLCVTILFFSGYAAARSVSEELVCLGGELTLNCSTNGTVLQWEISIPHHPPEFRFITTDPFNGVTPLNATNVARFYFTRTSISPLTSMILITNVNIGLNGIRVECPGDGGEVMETTVFNVIENGKTIIITS